MIDELTRRILIETLPDKRFWTETGKIKINDLNFVIGVKRDFEWVDEIYFPVMFRYLRIFYTFVPQERRPEIFGSVLTDDFGEQLDIIDDDILLEFQVRMDKYERWKKADLYPPFIPITEDEALSIGIVPNGTQMRLF